MKRSVILAGVFALLFTPAFIAAQTSDSATLNLTGNVPSLVRIGFGDVATQTDELAFGDLSDAPGSQSVDVTYLGNVGFTIDVESANGGELVNQDQSGSGLQEAIGYSFSWDGSDVTLDGTTELVGSGSSGIYNTTAEVTVNEASLADITQDTTEGDIPAAGDYADTLTFTITAQE
ncbi:MAG: hypothetical protein ACOCRN_05070 [Spirochaetia bacterium]